MAILILKAIILLALPVAVFMSGVWIMEKLIGRENVTRQLHHKADVRDRKPLSQRITGYDSTEVGRHWRALDDNGRAIEQHFLELDLMFPFLYGAALAGALLLAWAALGRPFHSACLILPVAIMVFADWTENLVQLSQLQLYAERGYSGLQSGWIQIASAATVVKLVFFFGVSLLLIGLVVWMVVREVHLPS
jgi:hypothetical protein